MKKISIIAAAILMTAMVSCDKIDDNGNGFYNKPIPEVESERVVLLEDYTGVRCTNCPAAGQKALELQNIYGENLIVLSVHAGFLSIPLGGYPDFRTEAGNEWYSTFEFNSNPMGTVNRIKGGSGYGFQDGQWGPAVAAALNEDAVAKLDISSTYDDATRKLNVSVNTEFLSDMDGNYYVTVCLMEDSIVGKQKFPGEIDSLNYIHRHMMRGAINGTWGEQIYEGAVLKGDKYATGSSSMTLDTIFNDRQCYVIAYVYDENQDKLILQAAEKKIK